MNEPATLSLLASTELDTLMNQSAAAFRMYRKIPVVKRAAFLNAIADQIEMLGLPLLELAQSETHLPIPRLESERNRTCNQLRMFAKILPEGAWMEATIDHALPDRKPVPKPDLRKMLIPLGPVVVFGASNFPFAYSTAGGDTASALAAGCPVVLRGHPAHMQTSLKVASAIRKAISETGMPEHVFQHISAEGLEWGQALVLHPLAQAVGFTGSFSGGKALFDLACKRPRPIPVFAEMGSVNPVCLLPGALNENGETLADMYLKSMFTDMGQFCTKPGLQLAIDNEDLDRYINLLREGMKGVSPATMLHKGIAERFRIRKTESLDQRGVKLEAEKAATKEGEASLYLASVHANAFLANKGLHEEVFGPYSLIIKCRDRLELLDVIRSLDGQLTATLCGTPEELKHSADIIELFEQLAGRIIINGVPTGVEVCPSMTHGGPFPATTDSRFTAVGTSAIRRFLRPVTYQNFPSELLPEALKDGYPEVKD